MYHVQLVLFTTKSLARQSRNQRKTSKFYHEGHEEHEVKKFRHIDVRNLRGLRVLRGENIFTANPEQSNNLTLTADADLAADDVSDQGDDDDDERSEKGDHGAALELSAEGIIERQQCHRARLARAQ